MNLRVAILAATVIVAAPRAAAAHFVLVSPESFAEQDGIGNPQKTGACGETDPGVVATGAVTRFEPGEVITVTIDEVVFHPGHYRVVLSPTGRSGLPPMPETERPGTCMALGIQDPPIFPVLSDGVLAHTEPFDGPQTFEVALPSDVTCDGCTLQVLEFMQADVGASDNCFYRHCADLAIGSETDASGDADDGAARTGAGCSIRAPRSSTWAFGVMALSWLVAFRRRALRASRVATFAALALTSAGCGDERARHATFRATPGDLEDAWLTPLGAGPAQTAEVCARGAGDPIARSLCDLPTVSGLTELYDVLGIAPGAGGDFAVTTHSLGLSARLVSDLNPRTVVFRDYGELDENEIAAAAFARGASSVELVGYDPLTHDFNFYLLDVRLGCEAGEETTCTAQDLLTERVEQGWSSWTLYGERDLEDTPLDCRSCHRPDGEGTPARLLMRQITGPWMHWGDFRTEALPKRCADVAGDPSAGVAADGAEILLGLDGANGRHGGVPVTDLIAVESGYDLSSFIFYAAGHADGVGDVPCEAPDCPYSEPLPFPAQDVLCDRLEHGRADADGSAWGAYRSELRTRGLPVPYFEHHLVDEATRSAVLGDFAAFVGGAAAHGENDAFTRLTALLSSDTARAVGFLPDENESAEQILTTMCVRCHGEGVDAGLRRSAFRATALAELDAPSARAILDRIALPKTSPLRMPPLLAGELPDWAIARVVEFLEPLAAAETGLD